MKTIMEITTKAKVITKVIFRAAMYPMEKQRKESLKMVLSERIQPLFVLMQIAESSLLMTKLNYFFLEVLSVNIK
ncbi:hypothetical protein [uncultured Parabacteroides sp.]|uniref:hypothetical protein n=1 Tax=uncultured Parabacteroides sp. TaxID=512312 RepID=UPI0026232DDD|nr:hypothetical protein [uncultured Parabacteroides sp.]